MEENRNIFRCWYEPEESELFDLEELFYLIKNKKLLEVAVSDRDYLFIRQWKDIDMEYNTEDYNWKMKYWTVYLTDWTNIYDIWHWRGEDEFKEWIESCRRREEVLFPKEK